METDGVGYSLRLANASIGRHSAINELGKITVNPIPSQFLTSIRIEDSLPIDITTKQVTDVTFTVSHLNPALYTVSLSPALPAGRSKPKALSSTLVLSQSFDSGWVALQRTDRFPFLTVLNKHVLVNNWANAWLLPSEQLSNASKASYLEKRTIIIFFWPQLLEFWGFALLPIPFLVCLRKNY